MPRKARRSWGGCSVVKRRDRYYVRYRENGRRRYLEGGFTDKRDAQKAADQLAADLRKEHRAGVTEPVTCEETLGQIGDEWVKTRPDRANDESRWNTHLKPFFGHLRPQKMDEDLVRDFIKDRLSLKGKAALEPATVARVVAALRALPTARQEPEADGHHRESRFTARQGGPRPAPLRSRSKEKTGGQGPVFRPATRHGGRRGAAPQFIQEHTMWRHLESALTSCGLPQITWYEATKHTFLSHYLMNGGRIERLATRHDRRTGKIELQCKLSDLRP